MLLSLQRSIALPLFVVSATAALLALPTQSAMAKGAEGAGVPLSAQVLPLTANVSSLAHDPTLRSAEGAELQVVTFPARDAAGREITPAYRVLIQGGLHGNEEQASQFVLWLTHRYARGESPLNQLSTSQVALDFLPFANPDGTADATRLNRHGVNLNRNFGVLWGLTKENPGPQSFSEPETRAIRALFKLRHYTAAVDVHGYINWIVSPSAPDAVIARGGSPTPSMVAAYSRWVSGLKEEMPLLADYQLKSGALLGDGGAFEDWAWWSQGAFAYCLEMETLQRYVHSYRQDFSNLGKDDTVVTIDLFKRYEEFIYRMFARAIELRRSAPGSSSEPVATAAVNAR